MTSIVERCTGVSARIESLEQREALQGQAAVIEERRLELEGMQQQLAVVLGRAFTLIEDGCVGVDSIPEVDPIRDLVAAVRQRLAGDATRLAAGRDYKKLLKGLEDLRRKVDATVTEAWTTRRHAADPVDAQLLERLAQVPGQAPMIARVRALQEKLRELGTYPPGDTMSLASFDAVAKDLASTWAGLDLGDLPEAVVRFFRQAQSLKGAPESMWTDEVKNWLDEHDMLTSVRVYFGKV